MTGHIIYYRPQGGQRGSQSVGPTATTTITTGLIAGTYFITIAATASILPSTKTAAETIIIAVKCTWSTVTPVGKVTEQIVTVSPATMREEVREMVAGEGNMLHP